MSVTQVNTGLRAPVTTNSEKMPADLHLDLLNDVFYIIYEIIFIVQIVFKFYIILCFNTKHYSSYKYYILFSPEFYIRGLFFIIKSKPIQFLKFQFHFYKAAWFYFKTLPLNRSINWSLLMK